jgi:heme exporter protein A
MLKLTVENLGKRFGARQVFGNISFSLEQGKSLAIVGPNGSGKTTLLYLIMGLLHPTEGRVAFFDGGRELDYESRQARLSLVAPYLSLYESLTARENLRFFANVGGCCLTDNRVESLLDQVGLPGRGDDFVSTYSSGMKQRLKFAVAFLKNPTIVLADEPGANLDESGKRLVFGMLEGWRKSAIVIIATNEPKECSHADETCKLGG